MCSHLHYMLSLEGISSYCRCPFCVHPYRTLGRDRHHRCLDRTALARSTSGCGEAARRIQCVNNLKQIVAALQNYANVVGAFPLGRCIFAKPTTVTTPYPYSGWAMLLPFIEQAPIYAAINFSLLDLSQAGNATVQATGISSLLCPSDA